MKYLGRILYILSMLCIAICTWLFLTFPSAEKLPPLKNGDLVFQTVDTSQTLAILLASGTLYSHVGIIKIAADGEVRVVEAADHVREVGLNEWISQGILHRIAVRRLPDLDEKKAELIVKNAGTYYGRPYDFHFTLDKDKIYCSELVYHAFNEVLADKIGKVEHIKDLFVDNPLARTLIEKRWNSHPFCQDPSITFERCYERIMEQEIVTPASIAEDDKLITVYSNYLPFSGGVPGSGDKK